MASRRGYMRVLLLIGDAIAIGVIVLALQGPVSLAAFVAPGGRSQVRVPAGFTANVFAAGLSAPRFLEFGPDGRLYVAESGRNRITALADTNGDGAADVTKVFATDLASPHSVTWHKGALYVGVPTGVVELKDADADGSAEARRVLVDDYPTPGHSTRTVLFLRDGRMAVSVGSSCNVCIEEDRRRAAIVVYDGPAGGGEKLFATGLRNAVGLALHPESGEMWATNNGRDWLGDDLPPETINVVKEGLDFGWPRCHAGDVVDPEFGGQGGCDGVAPPVLKMQAHSAPLGLAFYTGTAFPAQYRGDLFVALHGSWNRSTPVGYKVIRVPIADDGTPGAPQDFATGFYDDNTLTGRPVGLAVGPDGALYISDDRGGFIYRVTHSGS
ncbi:MAG: sorbosone dehydrogenase family protein [Candidatus Binatia bacterium]